jgi:pimeloyl-ACP methyl ester carboxylesterase
MILSVNSQADEQKPTIKGEEHIKKITINNYPMTYIEKGQGEPLLLIHGSLSDYRTWRKLLNEFSEVNRTIAVSLRHYYPEKWDGQDNDLGIEQDAEDIAAFIRKLKMGKVNLVGHSRGGAVAMLLASKHPDLVKRLVLADPSPLFSMLQDQEKALQYLEKRKTVLQSSMQHYSGNNIEAGLKVFVNHIAGENAWDKTTETRRNTLRQNAFTLKSLIHDVEVSFTCQDIKMISAPVLMVTGEYSKPVYGQMNKAVSSCLKKSRKATVADAGHMMYAANPTAFIFEVQDFVAP